MKVKYNKLWKILIDREMKKTELCKIANITTNSLAKLGKNQPVNIEILMKICNALNCEFNDIVEIERTN